MPLWWLVDEFVLRRPRPPTVVHLWFGSSFYGVRSGSVLIRGVRTLAAPGWRYAQEGRGHARLSGLVVLNHEAHWVNENLARPAVGCTSDCRPWVSIKLLGHSVLSLFTRVFGNLNARLAILYCIGLYASSL